MKTIWFWQDCVTPHLAYLADALVNDRTEVFYVANVRVSSRRLNMGWSPPALNKASVLIADDKDAVERLCSRVSSESIHICQGFRGNGLVGYAQKQLIAKGIKPWIIMEAVDDQGIIGWLKRRLYTFIISKIQFQISGILAIGNQTSKWLERLGVDSKMIYPFAYFLPDSSSLDLSKSEKGSVFRFLFVGSLVKLKRVDLLINSLAALDGDFELFVVGDGPMREALESMSKLLLPNRVHWLGTLQMSDIPQCMSLADCLVLPSRHDGWGAVVSEALMVGTPVICSDACGSSEAVLASGAGGVFRSGDGADLSDRLVNVLRSGPIDVIKRKQLAIWAQALGVSAGATYLQNILELTDSHYDTLTPPWINSI